MRTDPIRLSMLALSAALLLGGAGIAFATVGVAGNDVSARAIETDRPVEPPATVATTTVPGPPGGTSADSGGAATPDTGQRAPDAAPSGGANAPRSGAGRQPARPANPPSSDTATPTAPPGGDDDDHETVKPPVRDSDDDDDEHQNDDSHESTEQPKPSKHQIDKEHGGR